jgi:hypothetical protein
MKKPSGISDEEGVRCGAAIIQRAVSAALTEVEVYRLSEQLVHGSKSRDQSRGTGLGEHPDARAKEIHQLWHKYLRPRGYKLRAQIVGWPGGMPGDVGTSLSWRT